LESLMSGPPLLAISHVSKRFGGLRALDEVSLEVAGGEIVGLIGPNGAGKTTLFSALVGLHRIDKGAIRFDGSEVHRLKSHRVAALGLTKTFQNVALFSEMSVLENVLVGGLLRHGLAAARGTAQGCLERVGLSAIANKRAADLSFPERARVEVARALATQPKLLLLDEVMAALNAAEKREMIGLIRTLRDDGLTLIVIEHHMHTIMTLCDRVVALSFGRIIAEGAPAEIARNPAVVEAYLGRERVL
jgi:branched-chain amino acid transport system ATP-binding protein